MSVERGTLEPHGILDSEMCVTAAQNELMLHHLPPRGNARLALVEEQPAVV